MLLSGCIPRLKAILFTGSRWRVSAMSPAPRGNLRLKLGPKQQSSLVSVLEGLVYQYCLKLSIQFFVVMVVSRAVVAATSHCAFACSPHLPLSLSLLHRFCSLHLLGPRRWQDQSLEFTSAALWYSGLPS